jgi:2,5-diamino-6-(ribosylamino)-4(3H)-pyrimidinone 5'-phosphate reductase
MKKRSPLAPRRSSPLPFVSINVAMTADGKLAPANRHFTPFTSKRDQDLMLELRAEFDAVMSGARTVDSGEVTLGTGGENYKKKRRKLGRKEEHVRIIVSGSGTLDPKAHIFTSKRPASPIIILTTDRAGKRLPALQKAADAVHISHGKDLDFHEALAWLRKEWGVKRLLCEGGGAINGGLFLAGVVNEIYLTIAPTILGGRNAPTMADGAGFPKLADALPLKLKRLHRVGDELYTVFAVPHR